MVVRIEEFTMLKNEAAIFAALFWRDFYRSMLTRAMRNSMTKFLVFILAVFLLVAPYANARNCPRFVVALDLTKSTAVKGPDSETEFKKNFDGVSRLLMTLPAGASVTVIGITDRSFAQPLILLQAQVPDDPGYFGERLQSARTQIERAWLGKAAHVEPRFAYTDVLGSLMLAGQIFNNQPASQKILVIFSDMRHHTRDLDLESPSTISRTLVSRSMRELFPDLKDVRVYILGVDNPGKDPAYWQTLRRFWADYLQQAGGQIATYSVLRQQSPTPYK